MFVSILQRLGLRASRHPGEPLQSRADSTTRTSPPGQSGGKVRVSTGFETAATATGKPDNQVKDKVGLTKIVQSGASMRAIPKLLPRGDTK